jgi:hypothetical protein
MTLLPMGLLDTGDVQPGRLAMRHFRRNGGVWLAGAEFVGAMWIANALTDEVPYCPDGGGQVVLLSDHLAWQKDPSSGSHAVIGGFVPYLGIYFLGLEGRSVHLASTAMIHAAGPL